MRDRKFPTDEEGYILDENGERVLPDEPSMSSKTGKRKKAKPRAIKPSQIRKICELVKQGNFVKQSCIAVGVNYSTFLTYMKRGKKGIRPYDEYYQQVEIAKAKSETDLLEILHTEMENGNVGVIQWFLARKFPNRWERTEKIKAKVDNSQTINIVKYSDKDKDKKNNTEEEE